MDLISMKEKVTRVSTNIAIIQSNLESLKDELKDKYGLDLENADDRLEEIEGLIKALKKKEQRLYKKAEEILREIEDERS